MKRHPNGNLKNIKVFSALANCNYMLLLFENLNLNTSTIKLILGQRLQELCKNASDGIVIWTHTTQRDNG